MHPHHAIPRAGLVASLALLFLLSSAATARAAEEEHTFSVAPRYAAMIGAEGQEDAHAVGVSFGYRYGLTDFWSLLADATYALFPVAPDGPTTRGSGVEHLAFARVGVTYTIDALEWVPWLGVAVGGYLLPDPDGRYDGGASAGAGLDYRPTRDLSVGIDFWYHALFDHLDRIPATLTAGLRVSWYLR